jgi:lysylphosphatidylglycerol synthetase-like protein (DUF2156 family)
VFRFTDDAHRRDRKDSLLMSRPTVIGSLLAVALSLLLVGLISGTFTRHVVQVLPVLIAVLVVVRRVDWGPWAAAPLFVFWLL